MNVEGVQFKKEDNIKRVLMSIEILFVNDLNYTIKNVEMDNFLLFEHVKPILITFKKEDKIWELYFNGIGCKQRGLSNLNF